MKYKAEEKLSYYIFTAKRISGVTERIGMACASEPNNEDVLVFLNNLVMESMFESVEKIEKVTKEEAENADYYPGYELIYATNMYVVSMKPLTGTYNVNWCITGINEPTPEEAFEYIDSYVDLGAKEVVRIRKIPLEDALAEFNMESWTIPWDLDMRSDEEQYTNIWVKIYETFNDDNHNHAMNSFQSQGYDTAEDIANGIVEFIQEVLDRSVSIEEIFREVPEAAILKDRINFLADGVIL